MNEIKKHPIYKFSEMKPPNDEFICVEVIDDIPENSGLYFGFYNDIEHHTYANELLHDKNNLLSRIECFGNGAKWCTATICETGYFPMDNLPNYIKQHANQLKEILNKNYKGDFNFSQKSNYFSFERVIDGEVWGIYDIPWFYFVIKARGSANMNGAAKEIVRGTSLI